MKDLSITIRPLASVVGLSLAGVIFFYNYSIAGFGVTLIAFLFLLFITFIAVGKNHFRLPVAKNINRIFIAHLIFSLILFYSFYMNGSLSSEDTHYLLSNAVNIFWWHILLGFAVYQRQLFYHSFKIGYVFLAYLIIVSWILLAVYTQDIFFLRHQAINMGIFKFTMLDNPNKFARIALIVIVLLYFYYSISTSYNDSRSLHLHLLIIVLSLIVVSTVSRANIVSLGIFVLMTFSINRFTRVRVVRLSVIIFLIVGVWFGSGVISPKIHERFVDGVYQMRVMAGFYGIEDATLVPGRRARSWVATANLIGDNKMYGVGYSGIDEHLLRYGSVMLGGRTPGGVISVHGGFLKVAAYGGLFSLSAFFLFFGLICWYGLRRLYFSTKAWEKCSSYSLLVLLFVLIPMNIGADSFGLSLTWMSISFLFANMELDFTPKKKKDID